MIIEMIDVNGLIDLNSTYEFISSFSFSQMQPIVEVNNKQMGVDLKEDLKYSIDHYSLSSFSNNDSLNFTIGDFQEVHGI